MAKKKKFIPNVPRRERLGKKFYITIRDDKGRFVNKRRWSQRFTINKAREVFKKTGTLYKDRERIVRSNVVEKKNFSVIRRKPKNNRFMVEKSIVFGPNDILYARSKQKDPDESLQEADDEAETSIYERLAERFNKDYDAAIGEQIKNDERIEVRTAIVTYSAR